jgi:succinate dehydrogenase hydrophobic anchor subunit
MTLVAIVLMWRGLWGLLDEYLLPKNRKLSYWISSLLGLALIAAVLLSTPS